MGRHPSFQRTVLGPELARPLDLLAKGYGQYVGTKATAKPASAFTWLRVKVCKCAHSILVGVHAGVWHVVVVVVVVV